MGKILNYKILGTALKSLSDACFKADEQQRNGEKVTACGMSDDDLDRLCDIIPDMLNPMLSTEEVKEKPHVSDATLNRMVARGDIPNGECKKRGHTRYWKKWDILHFIKNKRGKLLPLFFIVFIFSRSLLHQCTQFRNSPHIVCRSLRSHLLFH